MIGGQIDKSRCCYGYIRSYSNYPCQNFMVSDNIKCKRLNHILLLCTYYIISIFLIFYLKPTKYCWYYHLIIFNPIFMPSSVVFFFFTIFFYVKICLPFLIQIPSSHQILLTLFSENASICLLKVSFFNKFKQVVICLPYFKDLISF